MKVVAKWNFAFDGIAYTKGDVFDVSDDKYLRIASDVEIEASPKKEVKREKVVRKARTKSKK